MSDKPNKQLDKISKTVKLTKVCKDFYIGAMNVMSTSYLPQWTGESDIAYKVRVNGTKFANMYAPIVDGLAGLITKKEPTATGYDNLDLENVDMKHSSLATYAKMVTRKSLVDGLAFVTAQTHTKNNRIYLKMYEYADLMSYGYEEGILTQIVFRDTIEVKDGEFGLKDLERYLVFKVGGGEIWYKGENDDELKKQDEWTNALTEIPIVGIQTGKALSQYEVVPKLFDIAIMNEVHLSMETNLANVLGVVGNPIACFFGTVQEEKLIVGVKDALVFEDKSKEGFEYVEINGSSIKELKEQIKSTADDIDKLTYSLLVKQDSKTVIDAQESQSKNTSYLTDVATELEVKFNRIFKFVAELENKTIPQDAKIEFKKEFDANLVNIDTAKDLLLAGEMSRETFYHVLSTGELPKDFEAKNEAEKIEKDTGTGLEE